MSGFDFNAEQQATSTEDEGTVVHIHDRTDRPMYWGDKGDKPVTITVAGTYSKQYRRAEEQIRKRPFKSRKLTGEVFYEEQIEKTVACTLAWDGFFTAGKPFELNRHNAAALYTTCPWVLDQVVEAMTDHGRFSATSSKKG
jgi:hypothetical protein